MSGSAKMAGSDQPTIRIAPLVADLEAAGYGPPTMLADAALRLARTPAVAAALAAYVQAGQPTPNYAARTPTMLFLPLPKGHTVASLMRDYALRVVGAFMMASELTADTSRAVEVLETLVRNGFWTRREDGSYVRDYPPASQGYDQCPNCGARFATMPDVCSGCGYGAQEREIDAETLFQDALRPVLAGGPQGASVGTARAGVTACASCGTELDPRWRFCPNCTRPVAGKDSAHGLGGSS